jgi:beta-lactamase superfamily II metal-dependent hydrolase
VSNSNMTASGSKLLPTGKIQVRMYAVGFGDCFLLSFAYTNGKSRHLLIDCGTSTERKERMAEVVRQIKQDCGGHLHGLVVTHRHSDHLGAFGLEGVGDELEKLKPEIVVRPWTEHPDAAAQATTAPSVFTAMALSQLTSLSAAQEFAANLLKDAQGVLPNASKTMQRRIAFMAAQSIPNKAAIERLERMGKATKAAYVYAGSESGLERVLPGICFSVLGPPTLKQSDKIKSQTKWDPAEFWKLQTNLAAAKQRNKAQAKGISRLFPRAATISIGAASSNLKWVINKLDKGYTQNIQRIVRTLDNAINNTSVILLIEVKNKVLLFPGDAQLENWQFALKNPEIQKKLKDTTLEKVGHHGSTNATPKSLWNLFANRSRQPKPNRMITLLSTKRGKHENVPRKSLVDALAAETELSSTEDWEKSRKLCKVFDM